MRRLLEFMFVVIPGFFERAYTFRQVVSYVRGKSALRYGDEFDMEVWE